MTTLASPASPPAVVQDFCLAATRYDFAAMFRLVDWPLSFVGEWARAVDSPDLPPDLSAKAIEQGFREFETVSLPMVQTQLGELALRLAAGGMVRAASDRERAAVLAVIDIPRPERALPLRMFKRLDEWRRRAATVTEVWVAVVEGRKVWLPVCPEGPKLVLVKVSDPG